MSDPTTGGVFASYAVLGDVNLAEPNALIGFAGARVTAGTIAQELPPGFQRSEFLYEHGFLDRVVHRADLRHEIVGAPPVPADRPETATYERALALPTSAVLFLTKFPRRAFRPTGSAAAADRQRASSDADAGRERAPAQAWVVGIGEAPRG